MNKDGPLSAVPYYFGVKRDWAPEIWARFGRIDVFIEPFCGSAAVTLNCPYKIPNAQLFDTSGLIINHLRAVRENPDAVIDHVYRPADHRELVAAAKWLRQWTVDHAKQLEEDLMFYDPQAAGIWYWGQSLAVGGIETQTNGRPRRNRDPTRPIPVCDPDTRPKILRKLTRASKRLSTATISNLPWTAAVKGPSLYLTGDRGRDYTVPRAILLDPPYKGTSAFYGLDDTQSEDIATAAYNWAVKNGENRLLRIAYCCGVDDFPCPDGWMMSEPRRYAGGRGSGNSDVVFFSPHCLGGHFSEAQQQSLFGSTEEL